MQKAVFIAAIFLMACAGNNHPYDASGTFEAVETIVSAEASGIIKELNLQEGQVLKAGDTIGYIDSIQLYLKKKQLAAQIKATGSRIPDINAQTGYYEQQVTVTQSRLDHLLRERQRIQNLVNADAATPKQLADINALVDETQKQLLVIRKQAEAQVSALQTQTSALRSDVSPLLVQIEQLNDQLRKCRIVNAVNGTVLSKYAETNEIATIGKPLYKIADLSAVILKAYLTGTQLPAVKAGQKVTILVDAADGKYRQYGGVVEWISSEAEFTPKTIQTKEERAHLVYAVKIRVINDGYLKIGMYGEVKL